MANERGIYIFGLHRSGTNLFEAVFHVNFSSSGLELRNEKVNFKDTWKHSYVWEDAIDKDAMIVVLYKNIMTWLESVLIRMPAYGSHLLLALKMHNPELHEKFISINSTYYFNNYTISLESIVLCYQYFYKKFLDYKKDNQEQIVFIKYEDLLVDKTYFDLIYKIRDFFEINGLKEAHRFDGKVPQSFVYNDEIRDYYLKEEPMFLPQFMVDKVNEILDEGFLEELNFNSL